VFVPLVTMAMGKLPNEQLGNAAGLYNLLRNVGGSIGISVVNTLLVRRQQVHQSEMTHSITRGTPGSQQLLQELKQALALHSDPVTAMRRAEKLLASNVLRQSSLWAYIDDFRYLALLCFACIPLAFVLQRVKGRPGAGRIAAH
jgi:DHA2 family multidrug resistance protein